MFHFLHQLIANFVFLLFGAGQVADSVYAENDGIDDLRVPQIQPIPPLQG